MIKRSHGAVAVVIILAVTGCAKRTSPTPSPP